MQSHNYIDSAPQPCSFLMEMETSEHHHNYISTTTSIRNTNIIIPIKDHLSSSSFSSSFSTAYLKSSQLMKPSVEDPEISIFDAQKYFDETSPDSDANYERPPSPPAALVIPLRTPIPRLSSVSSSSTATDIRNYNKNYRARSFHATPTASSEASWNSQTGLLSNPPGALPVTIRNLSDNNNNNNNLIHKGKQKGGAGGTKWFFGRKCPCAGKKSVQVKHKLQIPPPIQLYAKREINENQELVPRIQENELVAPIHHHPLSSSSLSHDNPFSSNGFHNQHQERLSGSRRLSEGPTGFSFPKLSNAPAPAQQLSTNPFDDPPRESLEVFQPWEDKTVPRKTGARGLGFPGGQMLRPTAMEDDIASDASSDLFEIESFSTQTTAYFRPLEEVHSFHSNPRITAGNDRSMYPCRRSMDEPMTPSIAPTEGYEPSEASIDWSVTTAEGFDKQSVTNFSVSASEIDLTVPQSQTWATSSSGGGGHEGIRKKGNGGGLLLLSCRHEKAVSVGPQPVKYATAVKGDQGQPPAMLPLVSSLRHVSTRGQNCNKPPSVAGSNSARLSLAFAA